jgi:hypothetical protein
VKKLIRRILREEFRNLSSVIEELLQPTVDRYSDYVCEVQVFQNVMNPKKYSLRVIFVGGPNSKIWPMTQAVQSSREKVMKEMWETIFRFTGLAVELDSSTVTGCKKSIQNKQEQNESRVSSTIKRRANQQTLEKYITKGEINYPTLCDDFEDGYEYADAVIDYAIYKLLDEFDEDIYDEDYYDDVMNYLRKLCRDEFGKYLIDIYENTCREEELDEQQQNEGEITERCWKGYTQKGMKTMFGKRYPNCVKVKKKRVNEVSLGDHLKKLLNFKGDEKREFQKIVDIITKITKKEYPVEGMVGVAVTNVEKKMWGQNFNNPKSVGLRWDFAVTIRPLFTQYNPNNSDDYGENVLKFQDEFLKNAYGMGFNVSSPIGHEKVKDYRINFNWDRPINVKQVEL